MKNLLLLTFFLTSLCTGVRAQCPVGNVVLETDAEVIAFANAWPNCTNLPADFNVQGNVTDVTALAFIERVTGTMTIRQTPLKDLEGLHNIVTVLGGVGISGITSTADLASLPLALKTVGDALTISGNTNLTGIQVLENLGNADEVTISSNASLGSLTGLDAVSIASELTITNNASLAECEAAGICAALSLPPADVSISGNAAGCANYFQVEAACTGDDCPQDITVTTNQEIIDIVTAYPNCVDLPGNLTVTDDATQIFRFSLRTVGGNALFHNLDYSNFDQLELTAIGGDFEILSIPNLVSTFANGPLPLETVGGTVRFQNLPTVENVAAFQNVTSIGGLWLQAVDLLYTEADFSPWQGVTVTGNGSLNLNGNPDMEDLRLLEPMDLTGADFDRIQILSNPLLEDISSLADAVGADIILIQLNPSLDDCSIMPVCSSISDGAATVNIQNNAPGCNSNAEVKAGCFPDLAALIDLYDATDGPNWLNNTGWIDGAAGTNCTPCDGTWNGITCDGNDRVTEISLVSNQLTGVLPASIGDISRLQILSLGFNSLTGALPTTLFDLPQLERIFIRTNDLTGGIPSDIGDAPALETLVISNNPNLGGTIPAELTDCSTLIFLSAEECGLTGSLPIINNGDLPNLRWLIFDENSLSGNFSGNYGFLTNLERIELNDNNFTGLVPNAFNSWPNLRTFHIENNGFINGLPASLNTATNLEELKVGNNSLNGPLRANLRDLVDLEIFEADANGFTGSAPAFDQSPGLIIYNVADNDLDGLVPDGLLNSSLLAEIDMSDNGFTGPLPLFPANSAAARSSSAENSAVALASLNMANNNFAGCYPAEYADLCTGTTTDFSGNAGLPDGGSANSFTNEFCQGNDACGNLPVSWLGFSARLEGKVVRLNWQTAAEENNEVFTVQRSTDGAEWTVIGEVAAGGFDYTFTDQSPLNGTGYYRIMQTDADGRFSFSQVASVRLESTGAFSFPNPFGDQLTVFSPTADQVEVYDANGRRVLTYAHLGGGAQVQKLDLKSGVYTLRLRSSGRVSRVVAR